MFFFLMLRRPPRSTRTDHSFPTRRSSDLHTKGGRSIQHMSGTGYIHPVKGFAVPMPGAGKTGQVIYMLAIPHGFQNTSGIQQVPGRSEEHTSELQSLMRISYAVFCLKKKKKTNQSI